MATLNIVGFDTGDTRECSSTGGTFSIVSSPVHSTAGGYALRVNPTASQGYVFIVQYDAEGDQASLSTSTLRVRFYFRYATKPASGDAIIFQARGSGAAVRYSVKINSSGNLIFRNSSTDLATGGTALSANTWYRIDVKGVSGAWEVRLNGVSEVSGSDAFTASVIETMFGVASGTPTVDFFYDDIVLDDADYPADGQCALLVPNGAGTYQNFTRGGADSGSNWGQVDDAPHNSDTDYLLSNLVLDNAETEALTTVSAGSVQAVKLFAVCKYDTSGAACRFRLRSGTTDSDTSANAVIFSVYFHYGRIYVTDPATGSSFTSSALADLQCGLIERSTTNKTRVTFTGVVVDYVEATGNPWYAYAQQ